MRRAILLLALIGVLLGCARPALAQRPGGPPFEKDVTVFVGHTVSFTPPTIGGAFGGGTPIVRFEVELAATPGAGTPTRPSGGCICVNVLLQSPREFHAVQYYGIGGFRLYGETFGGAGGSGEVIARNIGAGGKIKLLGQLRLRFDYRVFLLGDTADATPGLALRRHPQRVVAGINYVF